MKMKIGKSMKKTLISVATVALAFIGGCIIYANVKAADEIIVNTEGVAYQPMSDYADYIGTKIPEYTGEDTAGYGYVFGGWFINESDVFTSISTAAEGGGKTVYAKFVPAYVLSVKYQNKAGTAFTTDGTGSTSLKAVSSVDSDNYESYGFVLDIISLDENGNYSGYSRIQDDSKTATKVFRNFYVYDTADDTEPEKKTPSGVFGPASEYFTTWTITGIPESAYQTIICARPYWITKDGQTVYGLTKYAHVEDGLVHTDEDGTAYRYLNVPVNLRDRKEVAIGVLSVDYSGKNGFEFVGAEGGTVFKKMVWSDKGDSIKIEGDIGTAGEWANKKVNDIYVNLRFKVPVSGTNITSDFSSGYDFNVTGEDFCDLEGNHYDEEEYDVWKVKY